MTQKRQLHSDEENTETVLCNDCFQAVIQQNKVPTYSLASGIDYGNADRIFLPRLTLAEEHVIAFARVFIVVIKLSGYQDAERQSGKLGHAIAFPQYGEHLEEEIKKRRRDRTNRKYPYINDFYDALNIVFVGSHSQWAALVADKLHKIWHPIQVRSEVIYMWMGALKQFNSRYRDIVIDESPEMKTALTQIPDELISRATIAEHDTEIRIDRLVSQQSSAVNSTNDKAPETENEDMSEKPDFYPMSFLTRTTPFNCTGMSSCESSLKGITYLFVILALFCKFALLVTRYLGHPCPI